MRYTISFPTPWEKVNLIDDNVDVCLQLECGETYTLVIATPENLKSLMSRDGLPYLKPGSPFLIVDELTEQNILMLIEELMKEDTMLLHIYGADFPT